MFRSLARSAALIAVGVVIAGCTDDSSSFGAKNPFTPDTIDFGEVGVHNISSQTTVLAVPGDYFVTDVTFSIGDLVFFPVTTDNGQPLHGQPFSAGAGREVAVKFTPADAKSYDCTMVVTFMPAAGGNSGTKKATLNIKATGRRSVDAALQIDPPTLAFPSTEVMNDIMQQVTLTNVGDLDAEIQYVQDGAGNPAVPGGMTNYYVTQTGGGAIANMSLPAGGMGLPVEIHFRPLTASLPTSEVLKFQLSNSTSKDLEVRGSAVAAGTLACNPMTLDFGSVARGEAQDINVSCTSEGGFYTVQSVALSMDSSPHFSMHGGPMPGIQLGPLQSFSFTVRFTADGLATDHSGRVLITSGGGTVTEVFLVAKVVPPPLSQLAINVELDWNVGGSDLDLHFVKSGGAPFDPSFDCYWRNKSPNWGSPDSHRDDPFLDRDNTTGYGPEILDLNEAGESDYDVFVHYYAFNPFPQAATATVKIALFGAPEMPLTQVMAACGDLWHVAHISVSGGVSTVTPSGVLTSDRMHTTCP